MRDLHPDAYRNRERMFQASNLCKGTIPLGKPNGEQGHYPEECLEAGKLREGASGIPAAPKAADEMYREGCRLGNRDSCLARAKLYASHRAMGDPSEVLREACTRDVPGTCVAAGRSYLSGELVGRDPVRATSSLERACVQADADGCLELARMRRDGVAKVADRAAIVDAFRRACALGNQTACSEGAQLPGVARDVRDALHAQACFHDEACVTAPAGIEVAAKTIALDWGTSLEYLAFVGDDGHALLASMGGAVALVDPVGRVAAGWLQLSSPQRTGPQPEGWKLVHSVDSAAWTWDPVAHTLVGIVEETGYGIVEHGIASWAPASRKQPALLVPVMKHTFGALAISGDARFAIARDHDGAPGAFVLDLHARKLLGSNLETGFARCAVFAPDHHRAAVGFDNGKIGVVALDTGEHTVFEASDSAIASISFHPTRPLLVSVDQKDRVRIWNLDHPTDSTRLADTAYAATFSPDGRFLALANSREIVVLDATTLERVIKPVKLNTDSIGAITFSPDARYLAVAEGKSIEIIDFAPHAAAAPIAAEWFHALSPLPVPEPPPSPSFGHAGSVTGVVTTNGKPLGAAEIELRPSPREWPNARAVAPRRARAGKDGRYTLDKLAEIEWLITATSPNTIVAASYLDLRHDHSKTLDLAPNAAISLSGQVVDAAGKPAPRARVVVANVMNAEAIADDAGRFTLRHLPTGGQARVHASRPDGSVVTIAVSLEGTPPPLVLKLLAPADPRVARFHVVDPAGKPVVDARAEIDGTPEGKTDERGMVSLDVEPEHRAQRPAIQVWVGSVLAISEFIALPQRSVVTLTTQ